MAAQTEPTIKPPYVSYRTFINSINKLQDRGVPGRIDSSVFAGQSGSAIAALLAAYKYLGLMQDNSAPSDTLKQLASKSEDQRGTLMRELIETRYNFLTNANIDLSSATTQQMEGVFRDQGFTGSTITKAVSFFLSAAQAAGITVSKHVKTPQPKRNGSSGKVRRVKPSNAGQQPPSGETGSTTVKPSAVEMLLAKFPDFDPTWPEDIQKNWFESFGALRGAMLKGDKE